ncbi:MAG: hypothetical protein GVY33_12225 [Alphaproteobacteria bacterium]|jgi:hypothetical protein|nr:hypothetical protein [Alphaproteobacteria bacterium]
MRLPALLVVLLLAAAPAAALPEGRFAAADGASEVRLERGDEGHLRLEVSSPPLETSVEAELVRDAETGVWQQAGRAAGWWARLVGSAGPALPFDGERLAFAREEGERLIATTLEVDERGRPTMVRLALAPTDTGVSLEIRRFRGVTVQAHAPVRLERVQR